MMRLQKRTSTDSSSVYLPSTLEAMRSQEQAYACKDYLYQEQSNNRRVRLTLSLPQQNAINVGCRGSMMQWMQTVVNFIGFDMETVEIAMSYLDRFLQTRAGSEAMRCRTVYQLAAMTSLYTAIKINCAEALTPKLLAELSQGAYEESEFEEMEVLILTAIRWRVNPPTAVSFVRETLDLLPNTLFRTEDVKQSVLEAARIQAEWAVGDYELLTIKKSVIGFAAVSNALKHNGIRFDLRYALKATKDQSLDLDLQHSILIRKILLEALPEQATMDDSALTLSSKDNNVCEQDDEASVKSIGSNGESVQHERLSLGRSPRSVLYRNVAA